MKDLRYYINLVEQGINPVPTGSSDNPSNTSDNSGSFSSKLGNKIGAGVAQSKLGAAKLGLGAGAFASGYNIAKNALKKGKIPITANPAEKDELDKIVQTSIALQHDQEELAKKLQDIQKNSQNPTAAV